MRKNQTTDRTSCDIEYGDHQLGEDLPISNPTEVDAEDEL